MKSTAPGTSISDGLVVLVDSTVGVDTRFLLFAGDFARLLSFEESAQSAVSSPFFTGIDNGVDLGSFLLGAFTKGSDDSSSPVAVPNDAGMSKSKGLADAISRLRFLKGSSPLEAPP